MRQGSGEEEKADSGGGTAGEIGEGLSGLWLSFGKCYGVQLSGKDDDGGRQRLNGSGRQPLEGEEELGADVADFDPGGGRSEGVGSLLQGGCPRGVAVWGGDVGPDPLDGACPE